MLRAIPRFTVWIPLVASGSSPLVDSLCQRVDYGERQLGNLDYGRLRPKIRYGLLVKSDLVRTIKFLWRSSRALFTNMPPELETR